MRERPILMSAPMVRAILAGTKTVTRRIVKPQPELNTYDGPGAPRPDAPESHRYHWPSNLAKSMVDVRDMGSIGPYGLKGDRLWVRETWGLLDTQPKDGPERATVFYRATDETRRDLRHQLWRPSIFMPRWASRITLEVVSVRVERLHEIDDAEALREGVRGGSLTSDAEAFEQLWDKINGERAPWSSNPWVWRVEFRTTTPHREGKEGE